MIKCACNMCGKDFDEFDIQNNFGIHKKVLYGSNFDGGVINLDLCCDCFDKLMEEYILPNAKHDPVEEERGPEHSYVPA